MATANLLVDTDNTNYGKAYYMLTGTDDFEYILDIMVANQQITSATRDTYLSNYDGYRLRYMMVGMKKPLDTTNDTEAICLYSEEAGGALCAGVRYNGSAMIPWAEWVNAGAFIVCVNSSIQLTGGVD